MFYQLLRTQLIPNKWNIRPEPRGVAMPIGLREIYTCESERYVMLLRGHPIKGLYLFYIHQQGRIQGCGGPRANIK